MISIETVLLRRGHLKYLTTQWFTRTSFNFYLGLSFFDPEAEILFFLVGSTYSTIFAVS